MLDKLQELDDKLIKRCGCRQAGTQQAAGGVSAALAKLVDRCCANASNGYMQLADSVSVATQAGNFPGRGGLSDRIWKRTLANEKSRKTCVRMSSFNACSAEYYGVTLTDSEVNIGRGSRISG